MKYILIMLVTSNAVAYDYGSNSNNDFSLRPSIRYEGTPQVNQNNGMYNQPRCAYERVFEYGEYVMKMVCR